MHRREAGKSLRFSLLLNGAFIGCLIAALIVIGHYGPESFVTGLAAGFTGSLLAFMLALRSERERESQRLFGETTRLEEARRTEVRRRLQPVDAELAKNATSLEEIASAARDRPEGRGFRIVNPQLLEGAWTASASRLSELVADYKVIADLAVAYGRIEELRWRIRYRTEHHSDLLDTMIAALVDELREEVATLRERVRQQIDDPTVQPLGLLHHVGGGGALAGGIAPTGKITLKKIPGKQADASQEPAGEEAGLSFSATPGPGDSDGGDVYPP